MQQRNVAIVIRLGQVLIYNGDWDACVPYTDNEAWTSGMGYEVTGAAAAAVYPMGLRGL